MMGNPAHSRHLDQNSQAPSREKGRVLKAVITREILRHVPHA